MPEAADAGTVAVRGADLSYRRDPTAGSDRPWFVWGHGLTSSMAGEDGFGLLDWPTMVSVARVVRYDARGHGTSGGSPDPADHHWASLADDQLELLDALAVDRYVAGGASMGTATALYAALAAPSRVEALVLAVPPTAWETRVAQQEAYEASAQLLERGDVEAVISAGRTAPPPDPLRGIDEVRAARERTMRSTPPDRLASVFRGAAATDLPPRDALVGIGVPALVLAWTGDPGHPMSTAEELAELLPGARLEVASTLTDLLGWTDLVVDFLNDR